nr:maleylpyruvate isomerase N-terminal domain-containing protein [Micromonospora sp. DSM 115978]
MTITFTERDAALRNATAVFDAGVRAVGPGCWHDPTPCADWDVRALVNHVVSEQLWVPPLLAGQTIADVGSRFDGDQLGEAPASGWFQAAERAAIAWSAPGAWERTVSLSSGPTLAA